MNNQIMATHTHDGRPTTTTYESDMEKGSSLYRDSQDSDSSDLNEYLRKGHLDIEAQKRAALPAEHEISFRSKIVYLSAYFVLNLALTLSNKAVLGKVRNSSFCFTISAANNRRLASPGS